MKLQSIRMVTWSVPDVEASARAFERWLGQERVAEGRVGADLATSWGAPAAAGAATVTLGPPSGAEAFLRFVEAEPVAGWAPLMTHGWNAAELHVRDVHALASRLADSPFRVVGPPRDLLGNGAVFAMQVLGPAQELLYLTEIRHAGMQATYGRAQCEVDRVFIAVLGVSDPRRTLSFYGPMARRTTQRRQFPITVLARAHGLDPERARFDIASVVMERPFRIETDAYPDSAVARPERPGHLPPGLAMLTVEVDALPRAAAVEVLRGPDGELLECIGAEAHLASLRSSRMR